MHLSLSCNGYQFCLVHINAIVSTVLGAVTVFKLVKVLITTYVSKSSKLSAEILNCLK